MNYLEPFAIIWTIRTSYNTFLWIENVNPFDPYRINLFYLKQFELSSAILGYLGLYRSYLSYLDHLWLSQSVFGYIWLTWVILDYLPTSEDILGYFRIIWAITCYLGIFHSGHLEQSGNLWLYLAISGYIYEVSSIRGKVEAGESKLLLFETFTFYFSHTGSIEELVLLKKINEVHRFPILGSQMNNKHN